MPMPKEAIKRVEQIGRRQGMPETMTFADRHGAEILDHLADVEDDDESYDPDEESGSEGDDDDDLSYDSGSDDEDSGISNLVSTLPVSDALHGDPHEDDGDLDTAKIVAALKSEGDQDEGGDIILLQLHYLGLRNICLG